MIGKNVRDEGPVSLSTTWEVLEKRRKERELTLEQQMAIEHAEKFKLTKAAYAKLEKKLTDIGIDKRIAIKLIDLMPTDEMLLKQVLASYKAEMDDSKIKEVLEVFKEKGE